MKDIYELLNDIDIDENEFVEMQTNEVERQRVKKVLKSSIRKKRSDKKKIATVASLAIILPILFGVTFPAYGEKIPFLGDIFKYLNRDVEPIYENYNEYATPINITKESNGIKVTINEAVFDGTTLNYTYTIESNRDLGDKPIIGANSPDTLKLEDKDSGGSGGGTLERTEGNTYVGHDNINFHGFDNSTKDSIKFNILWKDIAIVDGVFSKSVSGDNVELNGDIVEVVGGEWNFDIELKSVENTVVLADKNVKMEGISLSIDTVSITPISTKVQFSEKVDKRKNDDWIFQYCDIELEDDLGNKYVREGNGAYGDNTTLTRRYTFNKIDPKATKLIIKPKAFGQELVDGVWDENRKEVEKSFEPIIIDITK